MATIPNTKGPRDGPLTISDLPGDLQAFVVAVERAAAVLSQAQADHAHALANLARAATGRRLHGGSATEVCARALGLSRQSLQSFAAFGRCWNLDALRLVLDRRDALGNGLTISHLVQVASLPRTARQHWIERIFTERLDVRTLRAQIVREARAVGSESSAPKQNQARS